MNQLYEAMPIPSSGDDELDQRQDGSDVGSGLDLSARESGSEDSGTSSSSGISESSDDDEREATAGDDSSTAQLSSRHRVFTTSSSPEEVFRFLLDLSELAEQLHARLQRVLPDESSHLLTPSWASQPPTVLLGGDGGNGALHGGGVMDNAMPNHPVGRKEASADHRGRYRTFIGAATCNGVARLRGRLRRETEHLRRAVDGLREAGCTGNRERAAGERNIPPVVASAAVSCAQCNSISHFEGIVTCLEREHGVTGVYMPISGYVGPIQCRSSAPAFSVSATSSKMGRSISKSIFADDVRIEVDVVSCNEHRWIKVKTATARNLELEAAALELNGGTPFTDMLKALCERAGRACLPHRRVAQVAVVLLHPPPLPLKAFLEAHHVSWASLTSMPGQVLGVYGHPSSPSLAWLPPLLFPPKFVCLDTTALVTLCSQSCFADSLPMEARLERLAPYHVLQEQQRKEAVDCAAVRAILEPALRRYTRWTTPHEINEDMRRALLREDEAQRSALECSCTSDTAAASREALLPTSLLQAVDLAWLRPLKQAAKEPLADETSSHCYVRSSSFLDESTLLVELSNLQASEKPRKLNWIIADVTYEEFRWILETIAGPDEVARATRLLSLLTVVKTGFLRERMRTERGVMVFPAGGVGPTPPKDSLPGERDVGMSGSAAEVTMPTSSAPLTAPPLFTNVEYLRLSGKVSLRNKVVFGMADAVEAVVVTSNEQLCHAAREQGVCIEACFHPSRSLTEQKIHRLPRRHGPGKPPAVI
ncbi:hypothetical protein ABL78_1597 [Leptomonas seymouri]|uniref:DUF1308 domain-containing protein n=1 Tax=Leptomonas seymouri TaxID=5684 RepID=A0A0N1PDW5_LEPSE|nr:hypothetical protein ABL78_1597 [Leptomonas seymouri]|eukprot:KPI89264.1 hypothetical protein ABL78_1597 [Leptomonas seymouri]